MSQSDSIIRKYPSYLSYQISSFEKMPVNIFENSKAGSKHIANLIALAIRTKQQQGKNIVLGLATGSSPIKVYEELVRMHKKEGLSFHNVITFNLDEYYPLEHSNVESYHYFMDQYLFNHIDIPRENINIPAGNIPLDKVDAFCKEYDRKIQMFGGLDIQILGIGRTGHIGFNEPGSTSSSTTRLVRLDNITRMDAAGDFGALENVPYKAITMGVKTILQAKEIYIMAWGQHKAEIIKNAIESKPTPVIPSTFLQNHPNVKVYLDLPATSKLTRVQTPWKVGSCIWNDELQTKAVIWLSLKINKPILKLTDQDYNEHGLSELILKETNAYQLNIKIFNRLQHTITGWPGGKPKTDDSQRPERATPAKKNVLLFSPHPDDDVISMGGTFLRLVEQGHNVHVAYQTSGSNAVHTHDVKRYIEFFEEYQNTFGEDCNAPKKLKKIKQYLASEDTKNHPEVRKIKSLIRRGEARSAARFCGLPDSKIHFQDLPFYESKGLKRANLSEEDIVKTMDILQKIKPHQVYAAGDLADPHGTHRICLDAVFEALKRLKNEKWVKDCWLWLYKGAWQEYNIDEISMVVPLSPAELEKKRSAIFLHESQKDSPPFPGEDTREFWQRSEDRNRNTANVYRALGFAEYEAMEAFRRWHF